MTGLRVYAIYKINCPDGRSYIGCTSQAVERRIHDHFTQCSAGHLNAAGIGPAIARFGVENITFEQIASAVGAQAAAEVETLLIAEHGTLYPNGFNLRARSAIPRGVKAGTGHSLAIKPAKVVRDYIWINPKAKCAWPPLAQAA